MSTEGNKEGILDPKVKFKVIVGGISQANSYIRSGNYQGERTACLGDWIEIGRGRERDRQTDRNKSKIERVEDVTLLALKIEGRPLS